MRRVLAGVLGAALTAGVYGGLASGSGHGSVAVSARLSGQCPSEADPTASETLTAWTEPDSSSCHPRMKNGYPLPDPRCTPGAVNPTLTSDVLRSGKFTTRCVRDQASSAHEKDETYLWYAIAKPPNNTGATQTCEKDHLVSLELGGADTLSNIWPQCGPANVQLSQRYFKEKDLVENYLAEMVRQGSIPLVDAQKGIAADWTQYVNSAEQWRAHRGDIRNDDASY